MFRRMKHTLPLLVLVGLTGTAFAQKPVKVTINHIGENGVGKPAGSITIKQTKAGLELQASLKGLPAGEHGFHLHENGSCEAGDKDGVKTAGHAAGAHYDPEGTKAHKGPGGGGHKGDLPLLKVSAKGTLNTKIKVEGVTMEDVAGRALMIHDGGDNYADAPKPLGGGGGRIACGVIPAAAAAKP